MSVSSDSVSNASIVLVGLPGAGIDQLAQQLGHRAACLDDVEDANWRRKARAEQTVIWVDASDDELAGSSGVAVSKAREFRRRHLGALTTMADGIVNVTDLDTPAGALAVKAVIDTTVPSRDTPPVKQSVEFGDERGYPIVVGRGVAADLADYLPAKAERVAIVTQPGIGLQVESGRSQQVFLVDDGEQAKRLDVVGDLASRFARWGMTRADVVVSVGGGVVSDLAGFVASTYHRGIAVVHISTTLLGQIDAAIGGKCGVNLPEGKNLVGSFWQPTAVLCEIDALDSLPGREFRSGMGELAKYHFLGGGDLDRLPLTQRVADSAKIKADVVSGDEREGGRRAILNYGHTLAHALETAAGYGQLRHGEAVAIGLVYAAEVAHRLGRIDAARVEEHRRVVSHYGLEGEVPASFDADELIELFARDKKAIDGITFVLDGPNGVESVMVDDRELLRDALAAATGSVKG